MNDEGGPTSIFNAGAWMRRAETAEAALAQLQAHHDDTIQNYERRIEELEADREGWMELAKQQDQEGVRQWERAEAAQATIRELLKVLKPFAEEAEAWEHADDAFQFSSVRFGPAQLRRARTVLLKVKS